MEHRQVGTSGLWVSEVGCGVRFTADPDGRADQAVAAVRAAHEEGVTFFQAVSGDGSGLDEHILAAGLRGVPRDEVVLCGGTSWRQGTAPDAAWLSRKRVHAAVHACLRRWDVEHLDVLALPRLAGDSPLAETFDALSDLVRQGLVHYVMPTEWTMEQLLTALPLAADRRVPLVAGQAHYSLVWRVPEVQALPAAERIGLGWFSYAPLGRGVFTGKYTGGVPVGSRASRPDAAGDSVRPLLAAGLPARVELLRGVAEVAGLSLAQLAVAWPLQHAGISSVVVAATGPEQVRENCAAAGTRLSLDTLIGIDELLGSTVQADPRFALETVGLMM